MGDKQYAQHLVAHAVIERQLLGRISHDVDVSRPCPWCGWPNVRPDAENEAEIRARGVVLFAGREGQNL